MIDFFKYECVELLAAFFVWKLELDSILSTSKLKKTWEKMTKKNMLKQADIG